MLVTKTCQMCGKKFNTSANAKKYCSQKCAKKARKPKKEPRRKCRCAGCGLIFTTSRRRTYCSDECRMFAYGRTAPAKEQKPKAPLYSLNQVAAMANAAGMTYGTYVQKNNL